MKMNRMVGRWWNIRNVYEAFIIVLLTALQFGLLVEACLNFVSRAGFYKTIVRPIIRHTSILRLS